MTSTKDWNPANHIARRTTILAPLTMGSDPSKKVHPMKIYQGRTAEDRHVLAQLHAVRIQELKKRKDKVLLDMIETYEDSLDYIQLMLEEGTLVGDLHVSGRVKLTTTIKTLKEKIALLKEVLRLKAADLSNMAMSKK